MSNFQKNSKDYGEPDITYQLAGSAEQRPLGIPMGDACSTRTSTAFKPPHISGIGNETGRFYLGFPKDSEVCDQDDLGFQESGLEAGTAVEEKGHRTAILKGQANARLYPDKYARQPGDIDIFSYS